MSGTMSPSSARAADARHVLRAIAVAGAALHAAGLVFALLAMRPGTPAAPLFDRIRYLAGRPAGWTAGWLVWIACAAALVAFMVVLDRAFPSPGTRAAAALAIAGAALDLTCDLAFAFLLPSRAGGEVSSFLRLERTLALASLTGANGLYSIAILAATLGLPRAWVVARGLGVVTFLGGALLAVAGVTTDPGQVLVATAIAIPAFVLWTLTVAAAARHEVPRPT
jgi:hypothetical protein